MHNVAICFDNEVLCKHKRLEDAVEKDMNSCSVPRGFTGIESRKISNSHLYHSAYINISGHSHMM